MSEETVAHSETERYWQALDCGFEQVEQVFEKCLSEALTLLSKRGMDAYIENARIIGKMGRGAEPLLVFLEEAPAVAARMGEGSLAQIREFVSLLSANANAAAIVPFLQTLAAVGRRLHSAEQMQHYLNLIREMMLKTSGSIHGDQTTIPSPGLPDLLKQAPFLASQLSLEGLKNWIEYGIRNYSSHPDRQRDYFSLQSADARAMLQRERHGTLFADEERKLDLYLRALWDDDDHFVPYSLAFDELRKPMPYYDALGIRIPDVYDDERGVTGIDRYRATLAHMAAHRRWSSQVIIDNYSPFQRIAIEIFEDSRMEYLAIQQYPGLRKLFMALHPVPDEYACDPEKQSAIRHRLAMLSRAILDPGYSYDNPDIHEFVDRFHAEMQAGVSSTKKMAELAVQFIARTRRQSDQSPDVFFDNTVVDYRDDNRHLWIYIEEGDEEEHEEKRKYAPPNEIDALPPRHYPEWDYSSQSYRPDWVSLYETLHYSGSAAEIDRILLKHSALAKRLKRVLDMLKPQQYVRVRYQEEGSELDLDVAIRALIDFRSGAQPDTRINMSHRHDGRDIAVMLLLDLSQSLNETVAGCEQSILELSQEAVCLLAWAIDKLGDPFAIAGFHSNTRHDVRYMHIKGYSEPWGDAVKGRLAAMEASYSTRMGAAMRHAAHYLKHQPAEKKLMLILTDGEPADIDTHDERMLIEDARQAVKELDQDGIFTYCINLDPKADEYVADIFGKQYTIIDHVNRLPERLPELFISLTK